MTAQTVLALDTSGPHVAAAVLWPGGETAWVEAMAKGQAERLMPLVEEVLAEAGLVPRDLDLIGVGVGPGNFTGIRIAVSAARGLALGLGVPAIGVSGLEATAAGLARPVTALLPAPRGQSYAQTFAQSVDGGEPRLLPRGEEPDGPVAPPLAPGDLVLAIARLARERAGTGQPRPAPLYLRPADAAPPKDPAPVLLP